MKRITLFILTLILTTLSIYAQTRYAGAVPNNAASNIAANANIELFFFDGTLNNATVNAANIVIRGSYTGKISGTFSSFNTTTFRVTFNPTNNFKPGEIISIEVTNRVQSSTNASILDPGYSSFTVATSPQNPVGNNFFSRTVDSPSGPLKPLTGDIDKDGFIDIVVVEHIGGSISWYKNDGNAETSFTKNTIISGEATRTIRISNLVDIDRDGDLDFFAAIGNSVILFSHNGNFANPSFTQTIISNNTVTNLKAIDLNKDGNIDLLASASTKTFWLENINNTSFTEHNIINSSSIFEATDIDNDLDVDIALATRNPATQKSTLFLFKSNGNSTPLFAQTQIVTDVLLIDLIDFKDINNDGSLDIVIHSVGSPVIRYFRNDTTSFTQQTIFNTNSFFSIDKPNFADLDGDGDLDAISGNVYTNSIALFTNNGSGSFTTNFNIGGVINPDTVVTADLNNDGDLELITASFSQNNVSWMSTVQPPITLTTTSPTGNATNIALNANIVLNFDSSSLNSLVNATNIVVQGSQTGIISGSFSGGGTSTITFNPTNNFKPGEIITVSLTEGLGIVNPTVFSFTATVSPTSPGEFVNVQNTISTAANGTRSVFSADLDGDCDLDVLSASSVDNKIAWYQNDGAGNFGAQQIISNLANGARSVYAADLDGDGDMDVLSASSADKKIAWYQNNGTGTFGAQQTISTLANGARSVYAADIDGDGDLDVLSASFNDKKIAWYQNNGTGTFGAQQVISTQTNGAFTVYTADIDDDGDLDVLSASETDNKIAWYKNNGAGIFGAQQIISTLANGAQSVYAADIDGDGDMDVLSASSADKKIAWYKNDGTGTFGAQQIISNKADAAFSVYAADLDGDGDMDVLSASFFDNKIAWYQNDGTGTFGIQQVISTLANGPQSIYAVDIDSDGDMDVLSASFNDDKIAWYENSNTTLSLEELNAEQGLMLFPNPVQNLLNVSVSNSLQIVAYEIYNLNGQRVGSGNSLPQNGIDVSRLASGVYLLKLQTDKGNRTEKFIKM